MIPVTTQLAQELGFIYWQLAEQQIQVIYQLSHQEKELLRKILHAKAVKLSDEMLDIQDNGVVLVNTKTYQLHFNDAGKANNDKIIYLAKLSDMLKDNEQKKLTWDKLKNLNLS